MVTGVQSRMMEHTHAWGQGALSQVRIKWKMLYGENCRESENLSLFQKPQLAQYSGMEADIVQSKAQ